MRLLLVEDDHAIAQSGMPPLADDTTIPGTKRTAQSLRFEQTLRSPVPGVMPRLADIDHSTDFWV